MSRIVEKHYSVKELAWLIGMSEGFIRERIKEGAFGPGAVFNFGGDLRIKHSAFEAWAEQQEHQPEPGIFAGSEGELRRKVLAHTAKNGA